MSSLDNIGAANNSANLVAEIFMLAA